MKEKPCLNYFRRTTALLEQIVESEIPAIEEAAEICAESIAHKGLVFLFGNGHSRMLCEEMTPRQGSLVGFFALVEASLSNHDGVLATPIVWAALDCPGAWADARDLTENPVVLGRMAAVVSAPIEVGRRYVVIAWNLAEDGRKSFAATALIDDSGTVVGSARQTWISTRRT